MNRSDINNTILSAMEFCREMKYLLPPFAYWSLDDWVKYKDSAQQQMTAKQIETAQGIAKQIWAELGN